MNQISYSLCGIRQRCAKSKLNINSNTVKRELESDLQRLNGLRAKDISDDSKNSSTLRVSRLSGNPGQEISKVFWFNNVEVKEEQNSVVVTFEDGHKEEFLSAEVCRRYETLDPSDYGPKLKGVFEHPRTGTLHIVNTNRELVCSRRDNIENSNIHSLDTSGDNSYNSFCSQCTSQYDGLITQAADLSIKLR